MGFDDDRDDDAKRDRPPLPGLPPTPRVTVSSESSPPKSPTPSAPSSPSSPSSPIPPVPSPGSLFRAPLDSPYDASFDWSPTHEPEEAARRPSSRLSSSRRFSSSRRRAPQPPPQPSPSAPTPSPPSTRPSMHSLPSLWVLQLITGVMKLFLSWWKLFVFLPFALTGWACWYLVRQLPDGLSSTLPLLALSIAPAVLVALTHTLGRFARRSSIASGGVASLPRSAGAWLIDRLGSVTKISVARPPVHTHLNAFVPSRNTILLSEHVVSEPTAGAYAVAAHELGHALLHQRAPRVFAALLWVRQQTARAFSAGTLLLWATVLTGESRWLPLAPIAFLVAVALQLAIALDEALASVLAMRELRRAGLDRAQRRVARRWLVTAFSTYAISAGAYLLPLLFWPQLSQHLAELSDLSTQITSAAAHPTAPPLSTLSSALALLASVLSLAGVLTFLVELCVYLPRQREVFVTKLVGIAALFFSPFVFLFLANQPLGRAFPWPVLLALLPARLLIPLLPNLVFALLLSRLPTLQPERPRFPDPPPADIPVLTAEDLRPRDVWRRASLRVLFFLAAAAPLSSLYLLELLIGLTGR